MDFEEFDFGDPQSAGGTGGNGGNGVGGGTGGEGALFNECNDPSDCTVTEPQCATATCEGNVCGANNQPSGTPCSNGGTVCNSLGQCVDCVQDSDCGGVAQCMNGLCVGGDCGDGQLNGDESDIDCGGTVCAACDNGGTCVLATDCVSLFCAAGTCGPCGAIADCPMLSYCDNGSCAAQNVDGVICTIDDECVSGNCADGLCCDAACAGVCEACSAALSAGPDGVCTLIALLQDPELECMTGEHCQGDGTCGTCGLSLPAVGGACPAECASCVNDVCLIDCNGSQACKSDTIVCPAGFDCDVQCGGFQGCDGASIACPADHACSVTCGAAQSCKSTAIVCSTGVCAVSCSADNQACQGNVITCGSNQCSATCAGANALPTLTCGASCACTSC
jgi:hypothetical protein